MSGFRDDFSLVTASTVGTDGLVGAAGVSSVNPATLDNNGGAIANWPADDSWFVREPNKLSYLPVFPASPPNLGAPPAGFEWDQAGANNLVITMPGPSPTGVAILGTYIVQYGLVPFIGKPLLVMHEADTDTRLAEIGGGMDFPSLKQPTLRAGDAPPLTYGAFTRMWNADGRLWNSPVGFDTLPPTLGGGGVLPVYYRMECDNNTGSVKCSVCQDEQGATVIGGPWEDPSGLPGNGNPIVPKVVVPAFSMFGPGFQDAAGARGIAAADPTPRPLFALLSWNFVPPPPPAASVGPHTTGVVPMR